jgi:hypothetical protein
MRANWRGLIAALCSLAAYGCTTSVRQPIIRPPADAGRLAGELTAVIKVHHRSGTLYVLHAWKLDGDSVLAGNGTRFGPLRDSLGFGNFRIPVDSVALLETTGTQNATSFGLGLLNTWTVVWGASTLLCVLDPKSCFGSCPTFYLDDVSADRPLAEAFSSSIARSLEASDIDDLGQRRRGGTRVTMRMTNEAWETHAIRQVRLRAVPVADGAEVFATPGGAFYEARATDMPAECRSATGDCRAAVAARDTIEWRNVADGRDLAAPDTMTLTLPPRRGHVGIVLGARQTFVSTYVLYQTMAYLGTRAGTWLARLERGDSTALTPLAAVNRLIGEIAIDVEARSGEWRSVGRFAEAGPIASDVQLFPLEDRLDLDSVRVRLTFARGNWRIGYATLAQVGDSVHPTILDPSTARRIGGNHADVRAQLVDQRRYLFSFPDDQFRLTFDLPPGHRMYALFLESRGYYYEWMRGEWLAEENPLMAALLLANQREALRQVAPEYKSREANYERNFWNSRFGRR